MTDKIYIVKKKRYCEDINLVEYSARYHYKLNVTYGFVAGVILDQILFGTFGYPIKLLKKYGKCIYSREVKFNKVTGHKYVRWFIKGFLE